MERVNQPDRCPRCNALYVLVGTVHRCIPREAPPTPAVKAKPKKVAKAKFKTKGKV
jgi:hypothetical protein